MFVNRYQYFCLIVFLFTHFRSSVAQDISSDFLIYEDIVISHDYGCAWRSNTTFKPFQWKDINKAFLYDSDPFSIDWLNYFKSSCVQNNINSSDIENNLQCNIWFGSWFQYSYGDGARFQNDATTLYGYFHFQYKINFKAWLYPRITTNRYSIYHYTGKPRPNRRLGFNTGETDMAGIGYFSDWIQTWIGRGRQNWGALALDNIALSEKSAAYDHITLQLNFNNLKLRYFHGYLETLENYNHRYISGRGIEYNNNCNLIIGAHEVVIYSGENRLIDIAYFNPIATHLEIELNQRDNRPGGTGGGNAIWQMAFDWMPIKRLRFSCNILADEVVLDDFEREAGKPHALAYQGRIAWSDIFKQYSYTVYTEFTQIGTYTLRHEDGANNFISRDLPLGSELGSDGDKWLIGTRIITPWRWISTLSFGQQRNGEENILQNMYKPVPQLINTPFPSGIKETTKIFRWNIGWYPKNNIIIKLQSQFADSNLNGNQNYLILSINAYLPTYFEL